jgi:hypothetical protein
MQGAMQNICLMQLHYAYRSCQHVERLAHTSHLDRTKLQVALNRFLSKMDNSTRRKAPNECPLFCIAPESALANRESHLLATWHPDHSLALVQRLRREVLLDPVPQPMQFEGRDI